MSKLFRTVLVTALILLFAASMASAATQWTETWESYTSGATPYDNWVLGNGTWMALGTPNHTAGGSKAYQIAAAGTSRIGKNMSLPGGAQKQSQITVEGWLYDSNGASSSKRTWLGVQNEFVVDNALVRIGCNNVGTYQVHYNNGSLVTLDTGLAMETGWHYCKLVFTKQPGNVNWKIDWRIDNAAQTVSKTGNFTYAWKATTATKVVLGYNYSTTVAVAYDDIKLSYVPEPSSLMALGAGLVGLVGMIRRRKA